MVKGYLPAYAASTPITNPARLLAATVEENAPWGHSGSDVVIRMTGTAVHRHRVHGPGKKTAPRKKSIRGHLKAIRHQLAKMSARR